MREAMETLKGKPKVKRTMWSRRAQEYEAKINSGDLVSIAEVVRDLFRADDQPEQSYSERQIFEAATSRLARELAAMEEVDEPRAQEKILKSCAAAAIYNKESLRPEAVRHSEPKRAVPMGPPFSFAPMPRPRVLYIHTGGRP
jgi:CarD family transcriptional regulator